MCLQGSLCQLRQDLCREGNLALDFNNTRQNVNQRPNWYS